ncbi:squalene synthase HpnC [Rhodocyclus gracilis]|uniref:Squalene synthase HpnC n=1 Tax=Rhodocyclus tenuis TaxID=1066 RepID=A0A6L5JWS2_RHOTE|nr:squalene synthase HpnC [Rhodocyclus gracilis]MQY51064.1 squalene synthase HpnC [Rhodocyclus gracilis]
MPVDHYENFPVASLLLPARLRRPIEAIYHFARAADDVADEGSLTACERQQQLGIYFNALERIEAGQDCAPAFANLAATVREWQLPVPLLRDLLLAFAQDIVKTRYADFAELHDYCRRSANPVGRLLLHLAGRTDDDACRCSDAVCTGLQLANFWQDVALDWDKGRVYLPQSDLVRFGVCEDDIRDARCPPAWQALMEFQVARADALLREGIPLVRVLPGRLGWEIRLTILGGLRILEKIRAHSGDVFRHRPTLRPADWLTLSLRAPFIARASHPALP